MTRRPLVLVPGLLCDALLWQHQIVGLSDVADCWVADTTRSASMSGIGADVLAQAPFQRFSLAGLSMGGYVALEIMRQAPERVTALALLDTTARPDSKEQTARRRALIKFAQMGRLISVTNTLIPVLISRFRGYDAGLVATIRVMARNVGRAASMSRCGSGCSPRDPNGCANCQSEDRAGTSACQEETGFNECP